MQQLILFQKYRIIRLLGSGGTSNVYLAQHIKLNSYRAIKCISKNHPLYELQQKEALFLKNLKHSCIPIIYDIEEDEESSYIVEQYIEGETLKEFMDMRRPIGEDKMIDFILQICDLLLYLHSLDRPILYPDLKPDNLIVSEGQIKLIDFGSAIYFDELKDQQAYCGTMGFSAPELYRDDKIDDRCEIYSIGMLLYYMVTGIYANRQEIKQIDDCFGCSKKLKTVINGCLKYHSSQRYSSIMNLRKHLLTALRKNHFHLSATQELTIAVAGSQTRIGVTHVSFRLCRYLRELHDPCLYVEKNASQAISALKSNYDGLTYRDGVCSIEGIPVLKGVQAYEKNMAGYSAIVMDFGCLTQNNLEEFKKADIRILIMGAKEWELLHAKEVLEWLSDEKDIFYFFNFLNGKQFHQVMKGMKQRNCYRVPYEPDPYARVSAVSEKDMFEEVIRTGGKQLFIRKGFVIGTQKKNDTF